MSRRHPRSVVSNRRDAGRLAPNEAAVLPNPGFTAPSSAALIFYKDSPGRLSDMTDTPPSPPESPPPRRPPSRRPNRRRNRPPSRRPNRRRNRPPSRRPNRRPNPRPTRRANRRPYRRPQQLRGPLPDRGHGGNG